MQTDRTRYVPRVIAETADRLQCLTGSEPEIDQPQPRRWSITFANDRVWARLWVVRATSGKIKSDSGEMVVDGERRELPDDEEEFARIFTDPDTAVETKPPLLGLPPAERPLGEAPAMVQNAAAICRCLIAAAQTGVAFDGTCWILFVRNDAAELRVYYARTPAGWRQRRRDPFSLIVDGDDVSRRANANLNDAIRLMTERPASSGSVNPAATKSRAAARDSSVVARRASVIRV